MNLLLMLALCALATSARADCEACVNGRCHSRRTLVEGFQVTDQLAIDREHNVLYLQLNSNLNSAFFLNERKFKLIQLMNTSGMAVDQDTQDLYVADYNGTFYKFKYGTNVPEVYYVDEDEKNVNMLFYHNGAFHYTSRFNHLSLIEQNKTLRYMTENISITDFVIGDDGIYYVSDKKVYVNYAILRLKYLILDSFGTLSMDQFGIVYIGDAAKKVIYKLNFGTPVVYAAYKTGSVDKFVFDGDNKIVFHDAAYGNVVTWELGVNKCKIHEDTNYEIHEFH